MKPRKMQPRVMWAIVDSRGRMFAVEETRAKARDWVNFLLFDQDEKHRVVRVRVTEAP